MPIGIIIAVVLTLAAAVPITWYITSDYHRKQDEIKVDSANAKARSIIDEALREAESKKREAMLEIREETFKSKNELEKEIEKNKVRYVHFTGDADHSYLKETWFKKIKELEMQIRDLQRKNNKMVEAQDRFSKLSFNPVGTVKAIAENFQQDNDFDAEDIELFNALTGKYENLLETGVVDPAKVTRSVVENAASVAGMLLTTEAAIVDEPKPDGDESAFQARGPMMM